MQKNGDPGYSQAHGLLCADPALSLSLPLRGGDSSRGPEAPWESQVTHVQA